MWFASKNHTTKKYLSFILASPPPLISLPLLSLSLSSRNTLLAPSSMTMTTATLDPPPPPLLIAGSLLDDDRDAGSAASSSPRWLPWARGSTVGSPPRRGGEERGGEAATRRKGNSSSPDDDDDCRNDEDDCRNDDDYRDDDVGATTDGEGDAAALLPMAMTTATTMAPMPVEAAADGGGELSSAGEGGQRWRCIFFLFAEIFFAGG